MKKYSAQKSHWKVNKALCFFHNFIVNHTEEIRDSDVFHLVASLHPREQWITWIREMFPQKTIERMTDCHDHRSCLDFDDSLDEIFCEIWNTPYARPTFVKLLHAVITAQLKFHPTEQYASDPFAQKITELQATLKLSDFEVDVLLVLAFLGDNSLCLPDIHERRSGKPEFIAKCLDCDIASVRDALRDDHKLRRYGCVDEDFDFLIQLFGFLNGVSKEPLTNSYYTRCTGEVLPLGFYGCLAEKHGNVLKRIISSCGRNTPTNILLYGAPGTGKSSFARSIASELKRDCYLVSQNIGEDREPVRSSPEYRFAALQICAEQVDSASSIIVVDEADRMLRGNESFALFNGGGGMGGDKGLLNSVLDSVRVPTIWITNTPAEALDESSRRRFDYSIRFDPLNATQRLAIWRNNVAKMKLKSLISDAMMHQFARLYPVSAGGITLTLENLVKLSPRKEEVESLVDTLMSQHCELLGIPRHNNELLPAGDYSLEGLNIKGGIPLDRVVDAIRRFQQDEDKIDRPRMNLLLSGPPGTGKTEYVKYLGSVLNMKVVVKMGSDLLSMYVGGTEQNIRRAFNEAEEEHAILFLDELDGLVQSRERATRNWEVTQVNELLQRMENFNGVMIGATNFAANLDAAIMRRFTFKLTFDYLDDAGKKLFFERMFRSKLSPEESRILAAIPMLAPGDFRTVRQSLYYLGGKAGNRDYLDALARESESKKTNRFAPKAQIGF
jgi:SpoVK/Ycf46/Vps4 family AAA+-type ATPase